jgi:hypothetical protein
MVKTMQTSAEHLFEPAAEQLSTAVCAASERPADVKRLILVALIDAFQLGQEEMSLQGAAMPSKSKVRRRLTGMVAHNPRKAR